MIKKLLASIALSALFAASANASSIMMTGPASVDPGDTFEVQVFGDFSLEGFIGGGIDLSWDVNLLALTDFSFALTQDPTLSCPGVACPPDQLGIGLIEIVWATLNDTMIALDTPGTMTLMATVTFEALGSAAEAQAIIGMADSFIAGGWFGGPGIVGENPMPNFAGQFSAADELICAAAGIPVIQGTPDAGCVDIGDVIDTPLFNDYAVDINTTVVPLPAAVWFMIGGLGTLLGFRRK